MPWLDSSPPEGHGGNSAVNVPAEGPEALRGAMGEWESPRGGRAGVVVPRPAARSLAHGSAGPAQSAVTSFICESPKCSGVPVTRPAWWKDPLLLRGRLLP